MFLRRPPAGGLAAVLGAGEGVVVMAGGGPMCRLLQGPAASPRSDRDLQRGSVCLGSEIGSDALRGRFSAVKDIDGPVAGVRWHRHTWRTRSGVRLLALQGGLPLTPVPGGDWAPAVVSGLQGATVEHDHVGSRSPGPGTEDAQEAVGSPRVFLATR